MKIYEVWDPYDYMGSFSTIDKALQYAKKVTPYNFMIIESKLDNTSNDTIILYEVDNNVVTTNNIR